MPGKVKKTGTWRTMERPYGKVGGTWRQVAKGWARQNGIWVPWYSATPPVVPVPAAPRMFRVSARNATLVTFRWLQNELADNVIDYEFVCVPNGGGVFLGSDPFMSNTPSYVTDSFGTFQSQVITPIPGTYAEASFNMNTNGANKSFRVRARNANGYGPWSDIIHFEYDTNWSSTFQTLPLCPDLEISNVQIVGSTFSYTITGTASLPIGQGTTNIEPGQNTTGGITQLNRVEAADVYTEPNIPATINYSKSLNFGIPAGMPVWPMIKIINNSQTSFSYYLICTTQMIQERPYDLSPYNESLYTLTVGLDSSSGGAFPDRGYLRAGAHSNSTKIGNIDPLYLYNGEIYSLMREGAYSAIFEVVTPTTGQLQGVVFMGYNWGVGEAARVRGSGVFVPYYESSWGRETLLWTSSVGAWQFVTGQTYTMKVLYTP